MSNEQGVIMKIENITHYQLLITYKKPAGMVEWQTLLI